MNLLFPPEFRTASLVQRWSIVRTIQKDSVANHTLYVIYYAVQIARLIEWRGPMADLQMYATLHDIEETISGDILGPVKREIVDEGRFETFIEGKMLEHLPGVNAQVRAIRESKWGEQIEAIVKVADKVDAVLFLISEISMGNERLTRLLHDALRNLREAWENLCGATDLGETTRSWHWDHDIWPAIQAHYKYGGVGLV